MGVGWVAERLTESAGERLERVAAHRERFAVAHRGDVELRLAAGECPDALDDGPRVVVDEPGRPLEPAPGLADEVAEQRDRQLVVEVDRVAGRVPRRVAGGEPSDRPAVGEPLDGLDRGVEQSSEPLEEALWFRSGGVAEPSAKLASGSVA